MTPAKETLLVSACLLGERCRYDGGSCPAPRAAELAEKYRLVPVCPEVLGGLPVPRPPAELRGGRVITREGRDVTAEFRLGAERALALAVKNGARRALLKSASPSCGSGLIHDGNFAGGMTPGKGVTAALLEENGITVLTELDLSAL
jgi:uncharacterized protein YbbK (DUF523 family)